MSRIEQENDSGHCLYEIQQLTVDPVFKHSLQFAVQFFLGAVKAERPQERKPKNFMYNVNWWKHQWSGRSYVHYWRYIWINYRPSPPQWFCVTLLSLSEAHALCGLLRKQSGLFIKPAREKARPKVRGEQNALDSWFNIEWDKYKHFLYQCHFIESNASPGSLTLAPGRWKCLSLLLLSFPPALITAAWVCSCVPCLVFTPLIFHFPHIFSCVHLSASLPLQQH